MQFLQKSIFGEKGPFTVPLRRPIGSKAGFRNRQVNNPPISPVYGDGFYHQTNVMTSMQGG